jgi:hypothetical protein
MGRFDVLEVLANDEGSFGENANDPSSNTFSTRLPVLEATFTPLNERGMSDETLQSRLHERLPGYQGPREGELTLRMPFAGHGLTAAGSLTANWIYDLLRKALGGGDAASVGDLDEGSGTVSQLKVTGGTFTDGTIVRVGANGDGRGGGHAAVIDAYASPNLDLLTDIPVAANAGDVIYASMVAHADENLGVSQRFLVGFNTTGAQWHAMGCNAKAMTLNFPIGGLPEVEITYHVAYWDRSAVVIPSGTALPLHKSAAITGNDLYYQTVATSTRGTLQVTELTLDVNMELVVKRTTGGAGLYQVVTGYEQGPIRPELSITVQDWESSFETLWDTDGSDSVLKHVLFESTRQDGRTVGFYLPEVYSIGPRPTFADAESILAVQARFAATEGPDTTNDLTRSNLRLFMA